MFELRIETCWLSNLSCSNLAEPHKPLLAPFCREGIVVSFPFLHVLHRYRVLEKVGELENWMCFFLFSNMYSGPVQVQWRLFSKLTLIGQANWLTAIADSRLWFATGGHRTQCNPKDLSAFSHSWSTCIFATWFYFISQHGHCLEAFCSLVWRYIVGVTVEAQWAEQWIEMSKGLLSAEAGGVCKLALLASSWARRFV